MKTETDLKNQAKVLNITQWKLHNCSMCDYPCRFIIDDDNVFYDNGCYCGYLAPFRPSSWKEICKTYNMNEKNIEIRTFWGFV